MILSKDVNPEYCLYNIGANILEVLIELEDEISFSALYSSVCARCKTSASLFLLALDWLYMIDAIHWEGGGNIKCL